MGDEGFRTASSVPAPRRLWSDAEWDRLRKGPGSTEWDASVAGDRLVLSDGETGRNIYAARFRRELAGWKIISAEVESDPDVYVPSSADRESERLQSVIEGLLR